MRARTVVFGVALTLLGSAATVGVIAANDAGTSRARPAHGGRLTQPEQAGEMRNASEQHQQMLERMQSDVSSPMLQEMKADPMWQMLRSEDWARMDEEHRADIDRMLGRKP